MAIDTIKANAIFDGAVDTADLASGAVTSAKLDTNIDIAGNLTVDTNTLYVDSANNRVGVGNISPQKQLHINYANSNSGQIQITNTSTGATATDGVLFGYNASNDVIINNQEATRTVFYTNGAERMSILSSGGLTFNGDTAAANALDDYEEGQWDAEIFIGGSSAGITYSSQYGSYVKIGSYVYCWFDLNLSSKGSNSGSVEVRGLPFAATGGVEGRGIFSVGYYQGFNSLNSPPFGRVESNSTRVIISGADSTGATNSTSDISAANLNNSSRLQGMITIYSA